MGLGSSSNTIMFSVIVSLVLIVLLYIIASWVSRYRASRRAGTDQLLPTGVAAMQVRSGETTSKHGLDPSIIASLPIFVYKSLSHNTTRECSICLNNIEEEEMAMLLPNCKHLFHAQCINTWLNSHSTCPICRSSVEPQATPETIENMRETMEGSVVITIAAPVIDSIDLTTSGSEDASDDAAEPSKEGEPSIPLSSSFCCMGTLSSERSERRTQPCGQTDEPEDPESQ